MLFHADWEAMGRTPLEALSFGVPVVASVLQGGLAEVLDKPDYAIVLDSHDVPRLTEAVLRFLREPERAMSTAAAGRRRICQLSCPTHHAEAIVRLLRLD